MICFSWLSSSFIFLIIYLSYMFYVYILLYILYLSWIYIPHSTWASLIFKDFGSDQKLASQPNYTFSVLQFFPFLVPLLSLNIPSSVFICKLFHFPKITSSFLLSMNLMFTQLPSCIEASLTQCFELYLGIKYTSETFFMLSLPNP